MFDLSGIQGLPELLEDALIAGATSFELFERISIPAGGGTRFDVPGPEGSTAEESLQGVVIHSSTRRAYWPGNEPTQGNPPDCTSDDGINGVGDPGGLCGQCPLNKFGSATNGGRGKACKETLQLFVLRDGEALPVVLNLPPSSLKPWSQYVTRLVREKRKARETVTEFTLDGVKNAGGISYSQIKCTALENLPDDSMAAIRQAGNAVAPIAIARGIDGDVPALETLPDDSMAAIRQTGNAIAWATARGIEKGDVSALEPGPEPVDDLPAPPVQSPSTPPVETPAEPPIKVASDGMMAALTGMCSQLGVPEETLAEYISETFDGRSYTQLSAKEVTETIQWLDNNFGGAARGTAGTTEILPF